MPFDIDLLHFLFGKPKGDIELPNESGQFDPSILTYKNPQVIWHPKDGIYSTPRHRSEGRTTDIKLRPSIAALRKQK